MHMVRRARYGVRHTANGPACRPARGLSRTWLPPQREADAPQPGMERVRASPIDRDQVGRPFAEDLTHRRR